MSTIDVRESAARCLLEVLDCVPGHHTLLDCTEVNIIGDGNFIIGTKFGYMTVHTVTFAANLIVSTPSYTTMSKVFDYSDPNCFLAIRDHVLMSVSNVH